LINLNEIYLTDKFVETADEKNEETILSLVYMI